MVLVLAAELGILLKQLCTEKYAKMIDELPFGG
jgi:hypothetical protein